MRSDYLRVVRFGLMTLVFSVLPAIFFLCASSSVSNAEISIPPLQKECADSQLSWTLPLCSGSDFSALSIGKARDQLSFSIDPPRPDSLEGASRVLIRIAQSKQIKRVALPARVDLEFAEGVLQFSEKNSRFWLLASADSEGQIEANLLFETPEGQEVLSDHWISSPQATPIQSAEEFSVGTPFRELGESRWWGHDVFLEKYVGGELVYQIEVGIPPKMDRIECSLNDWLVFKEGKWQKISDLKQVDGLPIARLNNASAGGLEIEGWDGTSHIRLKLPLFILPPLKMRGEELFAQLRVRSEKQVSCMLDKQCLILRPNDWILKTQGRWKILRKKEEKTAFVEGKMEGEVFVLDRIEAKGANKSIAGHYVSSSRSQMVPIEYVQKPLLQKRAEKKR